MKLIVYKDNQKLNEKERENEKEFRNTEMRA